MTTNAPSTTQRNPALLVDVPPAGEQGKSSIRFVTSEGSQITGMRVWCAKGSIIALQILAVDGTGASADSPTWSAGISVNNLAPTTEIVLDPSEFLIGITGHYDTAIENIVLHTGNEAPGDPEKRLGGSGGKTPFSFMPAKLPIGAEIVGFSGTFDGGGGTITSLGPVCQVPGPPDPRLFDLDVRWVRSTAPPYPPRDMSALPDDPGFGTPVPPIATYVAPKLFRVALDGKTLLVYDEVSKAHVLTFKHMLATAPSGDPQFLYVDEVGVEATVKLPGATHGDIEWTDGRRIRTAKPYDKVDDKEPSFGHVFAENTESAFDESPYAGWDITAIDPTHLQHTDHVRQNIFAYPSDSSHLYHKSEYGLQRIVPDGVMYVTDRQSEGNTLTTFASSEQDIQTSWKSSVGGKVGFGPFAYKANASFRQSVKNTLSNASSSTVSTFTLRSHILFIDLPRVELDPDFVNDVNRLVHGSSTQYSNFFTTYGTHFAYAITYGARAWMQISFSKSATVNAITKGVSVETESGGAFGGLSLGVNSSISYDKSTQLGKEISNQLKEYHTDGGEASNDGHLSLGNSPVPMLVDLRPITDLLNPVLFSDEQIYGVVRSKLGKAMLAYCQGTGSAFDTQSRMPPILRVFFKSARWKGSNPPDFTDVGIKMFSSALYPGDLSSLLLGFDHRDAMGNPTSDIWSAKDKQAPKLHSDGSVSPLGIEKRFILDGDAPPHLRLVMVPPSWPQDDGKGGLIDSGGGYLSVPLFRRDVVEHVFDFHTWECTVAYQLQGGDITGDLHGS